MTRRLFALSNCPFAHRVLMVLREKGLPFELVLYATGSPPPQLSALGSRARSPTLVDGDSAVSDSLVVLEYLEDRYPEPRLLPVEPVDRARVRMLIARASDELVAKFTAVEHEAGKPGNEVVLGDKLQTFSDSLAHWDEYFKGRTYAIDDSFSLADVTLYTVFPALEHLLGWQVPQHYAQLNAWLQRVRARTSSAPPRN